VTRSPDTGARTDQDGLRLRSATRAVLLDPADRILLVCFSFDGLVWACPGGGIEDGEADETALRRELDEEVGLTTFELGPCVWTREHVIPLFGGRWDGQRERFYLVRTPAFEPRPRLTTEELAAENVVGVRWWSPDELRAPGLAFAPARLPVLLADLLASGTPAVPIDAGV
jgi:8-oxo-dGTP pyrophosphatase MutT (NUDIX family)